MSQCILHDSISIGVCIFLHWNLGKNLEEPSLPYRKVFSVWSKCITNILWGPKSADNEISFNWGLNWPTLSIAYLGSLVQTASRKSQIYSYHKTLPPWQLSSPLPPELLGGHAPSKPPRSSD